MIFLSSAVALFTGVHLIAAMPSAKAALKERFGAGYGPAFGIASLVTLGLIIWAWHLTDFVAVYEPPSWGRIATFALLLLAFLCLGIFMFRGRLRHKVRFPLALAAMFWGVGHLLANGDKASLVLFGGLAAYGLAHFVLGVMNGIRPEGEARGGHDMLAIMAGLALYGVMVQMHGHIIGVPLFSIEDLAVIGN